MGSMLEACTHEQKAWNKFWQWIASCQTWQGFGNQTFILDGKSYLGKRTDRAHIEI